MRRRERYRKSFLIIPILSAVLIIYLHEAQIMRNSIDLIFSWIVTIIVIVINIITYILFRKQEQYHIAEGEMKKSVKKNMNIKSFITNRSSSISRKSERFGMI